MVDCWHCKYYHADGLWDYCDVLQQEYFEEKMECKLGVLKDDKRRRTNKADKNK